MPERLSDPNPTAPPVPATAVAAAPPLEEVERLHPAVEPGEEKEEAKGVRAGYQRKRLGVVGWLAAAWLVALVFAAVFADLLPLKDPQETFPGMSRQGPTMSHWFGGDNIGHDIFSRSIYGARKSLAVGVFSYVGALVIGGSLGLIAAYYRGRIENVATGVFDVMLSFPPLVLLIMIAAFLGSTVGWLIVALTILATPNIARIIRANVLIQSQREFVLASRAMGARNSRVMIREILPNVLPAVGSFALVGIANLIVAEGALAFLGISDPNEASWGVMINMGRAQLDTAPHIVLFPAMMIFFTVLSMNLLGDKIRDRLEVKESNV